jgi:hypothetical protein
MLLTARLAESGCLIVPQGLIPSTASTALPRRLRNGCQASAAHRPDLILVFTPTGVTVHSQGRFPPLVARFQAFFPT